MGNEKIMNSRLQQKHDIEANWLKAVNFIPKDGEIIVYDAETADTDFTGTERALPITYARVKIGNGINNVNDLPFLHGVGVETELGGEIFGDYVNNKADLRGHAEGDFTKAGWRAHAEGYFTEADSTGHSEGRCTIATGKGSHAEGAEAYINLYYIGTEDPVVTAASFHIDEKEVEIKGDPGLQAGDIVNFAPNDVATGFKSTDIKRIVDIRKGTESLNQIYYNNDVFAIVNGNEIEIENSQDSEGIVRVGDYVSFDDGSTLYLITKITYAEEMPYTWFKVNPTPETIGGYLSAYRNEFNTIITLNDSFRANNYYPGGNAPADGYIPAGATVKKAQGSKAEAQGSHAEGSGSQATAAHSHAEGYSTTASNTAAHSEGNKSTASGVYSHAEGNSTTSSGNSAHTEGYKTTASGIYSHAQGNNSVASEECAHAGGKNSEASAPHAFAHGYAAKAKGTASGAMGSSVTVTGNYSFAQGLYLEATGKSQHVIGQYNNPDDSQAFIVGYGDNTSKRKNVHTVDKKGNAVFTGEVTASNGRLISEDEARALIPEVDNSDEWHIIDAVFIEDGEGNAAGEIFNYNEIPEYWPKVLICNSRFADENAMYYPYNYFDGQYYFISGTEILIVSSVTGEFGISSLGSADVYKTYTIYEIGVQDFDNAINIADKFPVILIYEHDDIQEYYYPCDSEEGTGSYDFSNGKAIIHVSEAEGWITKEEQKGLYCLNTNQFADGSDMDGQDVYAIIGQHWPHIYICSWSEGPEGTAMYWPLRESSYNEFGDDSIHYWFSNEYEIIDINYSNHSYSISNKSYLNKTNPTGTGSLSLNRKSGTAVGKNSVAVGSETTASALDTFAAGQKTQALKTGAFAEGVNSIAGGGRSHAEGYNTKTYGWNSHAEGNGSVTGDANNENLGTNAHAEGYQTLAYGTNTHTEGYKTAAYGTCQHVQGRYNVHDIEENYVHIVGWGEEGAPKNIHTLDKNGNAVYTGKVTAGSEATEDMDLITLGQMNNSIYHEITYNISHNTISQEEYNKLARYFPRVWLSGIDEDGRVFMPQYVPYRSYYLPLEEAGIEYEFIYGDELFGFDKFSLEGVTRKLQTPVNYGTSLEEAPTDVPNGTLFVLISE